MVDFNKLKDRPKQEYGYRCRKCKQMIVYTIKLPNHMLKHDEWPNCDGILDWERTDNV